MRIAFPALILLLLALQLTQETTLTPHDLFQSSQIQLMVTLDGHRNGRSSFQLAQQYQKKDRILLNVVGFELDHPKK